MILMDLQAEITYIPLWLQFIILIGSLYMKYNS